MAHKGTIMFKVTIELPETQTYSNKEYGKLSQLKLDALAPDVIAQAALFGLNTRAMNAYNSGNGTQAEKVASMNKTLDTLQRGEWRSSERGPAIYTVWKDEVYVPMCLEQGMTLADAEKAIKAKIAECFPKDTKATFANYIEATAIESAPDFDGDKAAALEAVEAYYDAELAKRRADRAKVEAKVVAPKIDLSAFRKAKK